MQNGDIYDWSYSDEAREYGDDTYWCKTRRAIFHEGALLDTFWMPHGGRRYGSYGPGYSSAKSVPIDRVNVRFVANLDDLVEIWPEYARLYDPSDVVDLRHSNNSYAPVMVKKSATRSRPVIRDLLLREIDDARSAANSAASRAERLEGELAALDAGRPLSEINI